MLRESFGGKEKTGFKQREMGWAADWRIVGRRETEGFVVKERKENGVMKIAKLVRVAS